MGVPRPQRNKLENHDEWHLMAYLYPQDFGAVGDSAGPGSGTDDTAAIDAWFAAMLAQKKPGKLEGLFRYQPTAPWNLTGVNWGFSIKGDRRNGDGFAIEPGLQLKIEANAGVGAFYHFFSTFWINGWVDGPLVTLGRDDMADAFNETVLERVVVNNGYQGTNNEGVRVNSFCGGSFNSVTINCGGTGRPGQPTTPGWGTSLKLRQCRFTEFKVDLGNAKRGLHMADGYNYGNDFRAIDIEEVNTGIKIDNSQSRENIFHSGTLVASKFFECAAGQKNVVETSVNRTLYAGGTTGTTTGLVLR
jgi:hypothetical protein